DAVPLVSLERLVESEPLALQQQEDGRPPHPSPPNDQHRPAEGAVRRGPEDHRRGGTRRGPLREDACQRGAQAGKGIQVPPALVARRQERDPRQLTPERGISERPGPRPVPARRCQGPAVLVYVVQRIGAIAVMVAVMSGLVFAATHLLPG